MSEAAMLVGLGGKDPGRRLRRYCLGKERRERRKILIRQGSKRMVRYVVTLTRLRRHCPELFDEPSETERIVRRYLQEHQGQHVEIDDQLEELTERQAATERVLRRLTAA